MFRHIPEQRSEEKEEEQSERASSPYQEDRLLIMLAKRKQGSMQVQANDTANLPVKPLMDYKDDQFESMLMLRSMNGY